MLINQKINQSRVCFMLYFLLWFTVLFGGVNPAVTGAMAADNWGTASSALKKSGAGQKTIPPLLLKDVFKAADRYTPDVQMGIANRRAASGMEQAALGQFDMQLSSGLRSRATGYYSGTALETGLSQNLRQFGGKIYSEYRLSDGRFPIYEDKYYTDTLGEVKVGALFSLLRDRDIDKNRFDIRDRSLATQQTDFDLLLTRIDIQQQAGTAYWRWVMAGYQKRVYERLLAIAEIRQKALQRQVDQGAVADIYLLENQQNLMRRQGLLAAAKQRLQRAAIQLGYFLRSSDSQMRIPDEQELPSDRVLKSMMTPPDSIHQRGIDMADVLMDRPELKRLKLAIERLNGQVALRKNDLAPQLDVSLEVSRDFGAFAEGGPSRGTFDTVVGVRFSVPLGRNTAKGKLSAARAKRAALQAKERMLGEKITMELQKILVDLTTSAQLVSLAEQEAKQSKAMEKAERKRFENGASDFFLLNIREETAASAEIKEITAQLTYQAAVMNYYAATMNLTKLGL